jgi:magnesium transporter
MSIVGSIDRGQGAPTWIPWDRTTLCLSGQPFDWVDVVDAEGAEIGALQHVLGLHELAVEDSMSDAQAAKVYLSRTARSV